MLTFVYFQCVPSYGYTHDQDAPSDVVSASTAGVSTLIGNATNGHTQYMQAMMQTNGFASFPFPFNGVPGQVYFCSNSCSVVMRNSVINV